MKQTNSLFRFAVVVALAVGLLLPQELWTCGGLCSPSAGQVGFSADAKVKKRRDARRGRVSQFFAPVSQSSPVAASLRVGLPPGAECQTLNYSALTVYWSNRHRVPLCVAYELTAAEVELCDGPFAEKRKNYDFTADEHALRCPEKNDIQLKNCGYSRGHMAPAMDMRWSSRAMAESFMMTNVCPQDEKLNNGAWQSLERSVHQLAKREGRLVVLTGPVLDGRKQIAGGIAVPAAFFKILYSPRSGKAIAWVYANCPPSGSRDSHATTVAEVERLTGLRFFAGLSASLQSSLKRQCEPKFWVVSKRD